MKKITAKTSKQKAIEKDNAKNKRISSFFIKKPSDLTNNKNKFEANSIEKNDSQTKRKIDELEEKLNSEHLLKQRKIENNESIDRKIQEKKISHHSQNEGKCHLEKKEKNLKIHSPKKLKITNNSTECKNNSTSIIDLPSNNILKEKIISKEDSGIIISKSSSIEENLNEIFPDLLSRKTITNDVNKENKTKLVVDKIIHEFDSFDLENDFFDDIFIEDFVENNLDLMELKRCIVLNVTKSGRFLNLSLKDSILEETASVKCCDYWANVEIEKGQTIVIQALKNGDEWIVNNNNGLLVINPDILISGTSVVGGLFCNRQSILKEKFRGFESLPLFENNATYMTVGLLVHQILQQTLESKVETLAEIMEIYEKIISAFDAVSLMYQCNMTTKQCRESVEPYMLQIYNFIQRYMKGVTQPVTDKNFEGQVDTIRDIEENIWLPKLGLKGKIDVSVEVKINSKRKIMPLELKTGKTSFSPEHKGQVILYTMMMSMIGQQVDSGLLLYLKENEMKEIKGSHHEKRDLLMLRNTLSLYLAKKSSINVNNFNDIKELLLDLPEPINHRNACGKCSVNHLCSMYLVHDETFRLKDSSHPLKEISEKLLNHLKPEHIHYVMKWVKLHQIEEEANTNYLSMKDIWTMEPLNREKKGTCICNLKTVHVEKIEDHYKHIFKRNEELKDALNDFTISEIHEGDYVIINTSKRVNIAAGFICEINRESITISLDRNLSLRYPNLIFHVDKYFSANISHYNRAAVSGLLIDDELCSRLRSIVIEKKPATFKTHLPRKIAPISAPILGRLNKQQQRGIFKILTAKEYVLLKGFPGTGKTRTLIALVELLVKIGKSVLITANTHSAVDNILIGLMEKKIDFLRLGSSAKIHPSLSEYSEDVLTAQCTTPENLRDAYNSKKVVGVTCLGAYHRLFESRKFDMCLVDESTQAQQCAVLKPLYNSAKFVLVGDPEQLPPIAKSPIARQLGFNQSLFERLDSENNTVVLFVQYRMNKEIMKLSNKITYKDQLEVGNENVANATLCFKSNQISHIWWIQAALSVKIENSVILLNTFISKDCEEKFKNLTHDNKLYKNLLEAAIVENLVNTLLKAGLNSEDIGVIAPFRAQVNLLGKAVSKDVEVNTVDQYQGREKNIIIYSCTESSPQGCANTRAFHILNDQNRLTVAITRAKQKLIIIGDCNILKTYSPFEKLVRFVRQENIIDLFTSTESFDWNQMINSFKSKFSF